MADDVDRATDQAQAHLDANIASRKVVTLKPGGLCHYCDELLPKFGQLFCNKECSEEYEYEQARARAKKGNK